MVRLIVKLSSQGLLVLAALLSGTWSLLDALHLVQSDGTVQVMGIVIGPKEPTELTLRFVLSIGALVSIAATDIWDICVPRKKLSDFRKQYLDYQIKQWRAQLTNDIRVSVLYARRRWYWPFYKVFEWAWNNGFEPPNHGDANLKVACWQGVSGFAFSKGKSKSAYYGGSFDLTWSKRYLLRNRYSMTWRQISKTEGLRGIISVPLLRRGPGNSASYKPVGVINLDTRTAPGAELLQKHEKELAAFFLDAGSVLASLDM